MPGESKIVMSALTEAMDCEIDSVRSPSRSKAD